MGLPVVPLDVVPVVDPVDVEPPLGATPSGELSAGRGDAPSRKAQQVVVQRGSVGGGRGAPRIAGQVVGAAPLIADFARAEDLPTPGQIADAVLVCPVHVIGVERARSLVPAGRVLEVVLVELPGHDGNAGRDGSDLAVPAGDVVARLAHVVVERSRLLVERVVGRVVGPLAEIVCVVQPAGEHRLGGSRGSDRVQEGLQAGHLVGTGRRSHFRHMRRYRAGSPPAGPFSVPVSQQFQLTRS